MIVYWVSIQYTDLGEIVIIVAQWGYYNSILSFTWPGAGVAVFKNLFFDYLI